MKKEGPKKAGYHDLGHLIKKRELRKLNNVQGPLGGPNHAQMNHFIALFTLPHQTRTNSTFFNPHASQSYFTYY